MYVCTDVFLYVQIWSLDVNSEETRLVTGCSGSEMRIYKLEKSISEETDVKENEMQIDSFKKVQK